MTIRQHRLQTLGGLSLQQVGATQPLIGNQRKALALLATLAAAGPAGLTRERVMALLWSDSSEERARGSLKQLLHTLRRQLGDADAILGQATLRLNCDFVHVDATRFRQAVLDADHASAVALYEGPFLDGVHVEGAAGFEAWVALERADLARLYVASLEAMAASGAARGDFVGAVAWWQRLQAVDPCNGRFAIGLMQALHASGDAAGALRHARVHEALVRGELGAPPDDQVMALARRIASGAAAEARSDPTARAFVEAPAKDDHHLALSVLSAAPPLVSGPVAGTNLEPPQTHTTPDSRRRTLPPPRRGAAFWWAATGAFMLVAASVVAMSLRAPRPADPVPLRGRVAVAVLVNRTGDAGLDVVGTMASDWVTRGLARVPTVDVFDVGALYVGGRSAAGVAADPRALARSNGASLVVAGNYYRAGDRLVFSAQVVDVASGQVRRALDPISAPLTDPMSALDELRQRLASALGTLLDPRSSVIDRASLTPPRYDAYLQFVAGQEVYWRGDWESALPYFRRAATLDTGFFAALAFVAVTGVGTGRCALTDSVARAFAAIHERVPELDRLTVDISRARCASDHREHNRLQRRRAALMPGSTFVQFTMSTGFRQLNLAAEAQAILQNIDPTRDLGWLPDGGRSFYWREVAAVQHALGEYRAERATAARMASQGGAPLAVGYFAARSLAELGHPDSVLAILRSIADAPNDPALLTGIVGGRLNAVQLSTPAWVMYQAALELAANEQSPAADTAAILAIQWLETRALQNRLPREQRLVLAQSLAFLGRMDEAERELTALVTAHEGMLEFIGPLGVLAARQGDSTRMRAIDAQLTELRTVSPPGAPFLYRAEIAAIRGDSLKAMRLIEGMPNGAHPYDWLQFHIDPAFARLRASLRFQRFLLPKG